MDGRSHRSRQRRHLGEIPEPSRRDVAEQRPGTGSEYRGQASALLRDVGVTDGEDSAMKSMQAAGSHRPVYPAPRITELPGELTSGDDTVLPVRQLRQRSPLCKYVRRSFVPHGETKDRRTLSLPPFALYFRTEHIKKPPAGGRRLWKRLRAGARPLRRPARTGSALRPEPWRPGRA